MYRDKRILAVIPARGGSKGVKLKNIHPLAGKPLIGWVGDVVKEVSVLDRVVVSTDSTKISEVAKEYGLDVPFYRPDNLSGDRIGDLDVLTHALLEMEKQDKVRYDVVVMLQPTSPLRKPDQIENTIYKMVDHEFDAVWTVSETDTKSHPLKQLTIESDRLDYYDGEGAKIIARQQLKPVYHRNGIAYAISRDCILDQKSIKGRKLSALLIEEPTISIDTYEDFDYAEWVLERKTNNGM